MDETLNEEDTAGVTTAWAFPRRFSGSEDATDPGAESTEDFFVMGRGGVGGRETGGLVKETASTDG